MGFITEAPPQVESQTPVENTSTAKVTMPQLATDQSSLPNVDTPVKSPIVSEESAAESVASSPQVCFVLAPTPAQLGRAPGQLHQRRLSGGSQEAASKSESDEEDKEDENPERGSVSSSMGDLASPKKPILKRPVDDGMDK